jgi:hypothetical protein
VIVNQWVPAAHRGDAIGDSARRVRDLLRQLGHSSDLYALSIDDELTGDVRPFSDPDARRGDLTIFHYALPSPMTDAFASLSSGRILQYHNVTPAAFFAPYDPNLFRLAALGRSELATLAGRVDLALGDSEYNRQELERIGFRPTGVFPIAVDFPPCLSPSFLQGALKITSSVYLSHMGLMTMPRSNFTIQKAWALPIALMNL